MLPTVAGMTGLYHHAQFFSVEMESRELVCLGWPGTMILPISASQVTGLIGVCHCAHLLVEMRSHELFAWAGLELPFL
jgi:hypothetical protein